MKEALELGGIYTCKVIAIDENYDRFPKPNPNRFCHRFLLQFQLDDYDCQICTESTEQNFCKVGDKVDVKVSKFTKNQYTLESIIVVSPAFPIPKTEVPTIPYFPPIDRSIKTGNEPEMAIRISAEFHAKRSHIPLTDAPTIEGDVIPDAEKILAWIYSQKKSTKQL